MTRILDSVISSTADLLHSRAGGPGLIPRIIKLRVPPVPGEGPGARAETSVSPVNRPLSRSMATTRVVMKKKN